MAEQTSGWDRAKASAQAAIITGQVIARAAGPMTPPPAPPDVQRTQTPATSQVTQRPAAPGPSLADLTKQAADHQRVTAQQERRRAADLGHQLREPDQRDERPRDRER